MDPSGGGGARDRFPVGVDQRGLVERQVADALKYAALADHPSGLTGRRKCTLILQGRLKLVGFERREERGADRVVEHRGLEGLRARCRWDRGSPRSPQTPARSMSASTNFQPQSGSRARHGRSPLDGIPERSRSLAHQLRLPARLIMTPSRPRPRLRRAPAFGARRGGQGPRATRPGRRSPAPGPGRAATGPRTCR
jgi:hypothetical protein